ncbi:glycoside hydrolase family 38 C-terminal domain-containing protein [Streptomyces sp. TS71-3]|uniref:alpha-mannosidase n=1 Tax=Streptomyces sp. TS71-3 TaxID=2733862 RepID=UPI001B29DA6B|nr:glycoside hydrolase family 38 C-terminal domain-containing protein [Streptomyces sp. TS71-3]GHJ42409.1 putative glycosyl hydrolase [Streptomyces sp. TS71-3]
MHDRRDSGEERITAFLAERLRPALYPQRVPLDVSAWHIPGEPVPAGIALRASYAPFAVGDPWGSPWSTTWFRVHAAVPERWAGRRVDLLVDLGGTDGAAGGPAALVHDAHGTPLNGLHPGADPLPVRLRARGGEQVRLLIEAAADPPIDPDRGTGLLHGDPATAGDTPLYRLRSADLAVRDDGVWRLLHDMAALADLMRALPAGSARRQELSHALERAMDAVDPAAAARTASRARERLGPVLARRAGDSAGSLAVVGRAPVGMGLRPAHEAVRACARAFSTLATLAAEYPELVVAVPGAQHHAWMKEHQPHVFERIRKAVADGNWAPVGGMWVPADTELAGGESLVRQFVHGRRFLRDELGADSDGVWLPDAMGASPALPQLARLAGATWLLARRPAPDHAPAPPHHTFRWEGIDGTALLTHLAPGAPEDGAPALTGAGASAPTPAGPATRALLPAGRPAAGPDRALLERTRRLADLDGAPKVTMQHPAAFFRTARDEHPDSPVVRGALDLAPHCGGFTSQARTKRANRLSESLLHEAELWSATAAVRLGIGYPHDELDALWKQVLAQQSDDVLSGAGIAWVHADAEAAHRLAQRRLERLVRRAAGEPDGTAVLNPAPVPRREVVVLDAPAGPVPGTAQLMPDGRLAVLAEAPALGAGPAGIPLGGTAPVSVRPAAGGGHLLDNALLRVHIGPDGLVRSLVDLATGRDAIAPGAAGNLLQLHREGTGRTGARDLDPRPGTIRDLDGAARVAVYAHGPLLATVRVSRVTGRSTVVQDLTLTAGSRALSIGTDVDWRERDTVLTCAWPLDVHAEQSRAGIQFGHVTHPVHEDGDGDPARHQATAHGWIHLGEHGWGVALATDTVHGHDVARRTRADGGTTTVLRTTLLRAPGRPDPHADRGPQRFRHALVPAADTADARDAGQVLCHPLRPGPAGPPGPPLVAVDNPDVVIDTVKLADDRSGDVVVRLHESRGGRAAVRLAVGCAATAVHETDLLEERSAEHPLRGGGVRLTLRPFQILTLRLVRGPVPCDAPEGHGA